MNKSVLKYNDGLDYMLTIEDSTCKVVAARWKGAAISVGHYGFLKYDTVLGKVKYHKDTIFVSYNKEEFNGYYTHIYYGYDSVFIVRDVGFYYPYSTRKEREKYPYVKVSERQIKKQIRKLRKRPQYYIKGPED